MKEKVTDPLHVLIRTHSQASISFNARGLIPFSFLVDANKPERGQGGENAALRNLTCAGEKEKASNSQGILHNTPGSCHICVQLISLAILALTLRNIRVSALLRLDVFPSLKITTLYEYIPVRSYWYGNVILRGKLH